MNIYQRQQPDKTNKMSESSKSFLKASEVIADLIIVYLERTNKDANWLANESNLPVERIQKIFLGEYDMKLSDIVQIETALGVNILSRCQEYQIEHETNELIAYARDASIKLSLSSDIMNDIEVRCYVDTLLRICIIWIGDSEVYDMGEYWEVVNDVFIGCSEEFPSFGFLFTSTSSLTQILPTEKGVFCCMNGKEI